MNTVPSGPVCSCGAAGVSGAGVVSADGGVAVSADGVVILEPTLGGQPSAERLLRYGDLLRAAGRQVEAERAYDRAAESRG